MSTANLQRGRQQGANTVAGAVILGTLPASVVAFLTDDPATAVILSTGWAWVVAAMAGAYVNFTKP